MAQPVIGLTLDSEPPGGYSQLPWYALRENYCAAVSRAGGLPVLLAHEVEQGTPRSEPGHIVRFADGTRLREIAACGEAPVNSTHHQAVKAPAPGLIVDATAPDGVIEGIEDPRRRFCIGVQWHPEYAVSEADLRLFTAFIEAAR